MSKERARNRAAREREAGIKAAARGEARARQEQAGRRTHGKAPVKPAVKGAGNAHGTARPGVKRPPKKNRPHPPPARPRRFARAGRPDGPLARRRRFRVRLLVVLLLVANVAAGVFWREWTVSLAVLIVSVIVTPLLAALLLRRR